MFDAFIEPEYNTLRERLNCRWNAGTERYVYLGYERPCLPSPVLHELVVDRAKHHRVDVHEVLRRLEARPELLQARLNWIQRMGYLVP